VSDQSQASGERPLTPGDEPPPVGSAGDQPTVIRPAAADQPTVARPAAADQPTVVETGVPSPSEAPAQAAPPATQSPSAPPQAVQLPPPLPLAQPAFSGSASAASERPEIAVGGAFAGGLVLALILKRLAR
jgi:hypothetical protein